MPDVSKLGSIEEELKALKDELGSYRDAVLAAFGVYTANPRATLLHFAREWEEDRQALMVLMGQRCAVCQTPATREVPGHDTHFCDEHEYVDLPRDMQEALSDCGVPGKPRLEDIPFAASVRRALALSPTAFRNRN